MSKFDSRCSCELISADGSGIILIAHLASTNIMEIATPHLLFAGTNAPLFVTSDTLRQAQDKHVLAVRRGGEVLERYDLIVDVVVSKNPGYVVYEDEFQVAAIPYGKEIQMVL